MKMLITMGAVVIGTVLATAGGANAADTQLPLPDRKSGYLPPPSHGCSQTS
jgi:hypothetical protein